MIRFCVNYDLHEGLCHDLVKFYDMMFRTLDDMTLLKFCDMTFRRFDDMTLFGSYVTFMVVYGMTL